MGLSQRRRNATHDSVSQAIVEAVADREGVDVTELEPPRFDPLYTVVDPEALDSLFAPTHGGETRGRGTVTFDYEGYAITVYSDGRIDIE